jgi:hypothetical protein
MIPVKISSSIDKGHNLWYTKSRIIAGFAFGFLFVILSLCHGDSESFSSLCSGKEVMPISSSHPYLPLDLSSDQTKARKMKLEKRLPLTPL